MKNLNKFILLGTALFAIAACQRESKVQENPNYDPEKGEVLTNFVFSVATGNSPATKQTAANVQAELTDGFRGIDNASLLAYKQGTANDGKTLAAASAAEKEFKLGTVLSNNYWGAQSGTQDKSKRILELALPTETNTLLFYGKAIKDGDDDAQGKIDWTVGKNVDDNSFKLTRRISGDNETAFTQYQKMIALILTRIAKNGFNGASDDKVNTTEKEVTYGGVTAKPALNWSDYVTVSGTVITVKTKSPVPGYEGEDITPLEEILGDAFKAFNTVYENEIRAGSGSAIARMVGDLWSVIDNVRTATPTSYPEAVAVAMADRIHTRLGNYFTEKGANCKWSTSAKDNLKTHLNDAAKATFDSDYNKVDNSKLDEFPTNFNVPFGATQLSYDVATHTYSYVTSLPMSGMGGGTTSVLNYMYPAELCYFGNSPIRVTDDAHEITDYPDGVANWVKEDEWKAGVHNNTVAWTTGHVLSTTRSVAMKQNINYGTALLKTTVRYGAEELKDNNAAIQHDRTGATENDNIIKTNTDSPFTIIGVVVGGQAEEMGWNFIAKTATFDRMIYDNKLASTNIPVYVDGSQKSDANYTLVWDNWSSAHAGAKQDPVYIALEFVNNTGKDFWGKDNLIRNGGTFYIIGKLDPNAGKSDSDMSDGITWPSEQALPPYASDGSTLKERRVFIQDFVTEANFIIGAESLHYAYVTVPDLRSTQISLGLSVDLKWQTGLTFDVTLGN